MTTWLFLALLLIGIGLMAKKKARWFFTVACAGYLVVLFVTLETDPPAAAGSAPSLSELLGSTFGVYLAECVVFLVLAYFSFRREKPGRNG